MSDDQSRQLLADIAALNADAEGFERDVEPITRFTQALTDLEQAAAQYRESGTVAHDAIEQAVNTIDSSYQGAAQFLKRYGIDPKPLLVWVQTKPVEGIAHLRVLIQGAGIAARDRWEQCKKSISVLMAKAQADARQGEQAEGAGTNHDPAEGEQAEGAGADGGHGKRTETVPNDEANIAARNYIAQREKAGEKCTARDVASACGIALGRVSGLPAWQAYQAKKKSGVPSHKPKKARQLTDEMLAYAGKDDDPSAKLASAEENAWRYLLENATPEERARLNAKPSAEKAEIIRLAIDQITDQDE